MRPGRVDLPVARGANCLVASIRILAVQRFENLRIESTNETHAEDRRELPGLVVAGERGTDRIRVPISRRAHRRLQDSPSHLSWNAGVLIELTQRRLDPIERRL